MELNRGGLAGERTRLVCVWMVDVVEEAIAYVISLRVERLGRVAEDARLLSAGGERLGLGR